MNTHPYTQYPLLSVKETVKDNVPVDTESVIHKLGKSLCSIVCGGELTVHRTSSQPHHYVLLSYRYEKN